LKLQLIARIAPPHQNRGMDINTLAKSIVDQATGEKPVKKPSVQAVIRGKKRIQQLSEAGTLSEHQQNAANKRWTAAGSSVKMESGE
jgi:hypothetical protein